MAHLYTKNDPLSLYWDRKSSNTREEWLEKIKECTTVYVGNLAFHTNEEQILEIFSKVGQVKKIVMGLNSKAKNPCGFCFVQYFTHEETARCHSLLTGSTLDNRTIRIDWDSGEGIDSDRKYGRAPTGYQWRDQLRITNDDGRGGIVAVNDKEESTTGERSFRYKRKRDNFPNGHHSHTSSRYPPHQTHIKKNTNLKI